MRHRESKVFAEILNRLREGIHTNDDIVKLTINPLIDIPQNKKVNDFNGKVHQAATGEKYTIKSQDDVIGANSSELRDKIMKRITDDP